MLFRTSLIREYAEAGIATFFVLFGITLTTQFIRFLGYAAKGSIATDAVFTFLGFATLKYFPVIMLVTIFISILLVLTRSFRDYEMFVWFTFGQSLGRWISPTLVYSAPMILLVGFMSLFLSPWATGKTEEFKRQLESRDEVSAISPGVFKESRSGDRVFFVDKLAMDLTIVQNIFMYSQENGETGVTVAKRGYQELASPEQHYLVLEKGRRYLGPTGTAAFKIVEFDEYGAKIESKKIEQYVPSVRAQSTLSLLENKDSGSKAELIWRVGFPISAILLAVLAIPLSFVNPRAGRSANLLAAILVYLVYSNVLNMMQAWIAKGLVAPLVGLFSIHGFMIFMIVLLFYTRSSVNRRHLISVIKK